MAILWSSCPHLYSTNGESHVTISDAAIKVAQTTINLFYCSSCTLVMTPVEST